MNLENLANDADSATKEVVHTIASGDKNSFLLSELVQLTGFTKEELLQSLLFLQRYFACLCDKKCDDFVIIKGENFDVFFNATK
jgi:hypothetical protein